MSGRRNPAAKWVTPDVIDPPDHICITVPVPNDRKHIAAFWGALYNLTSARFWEDDTAHTAKLVAKVWEKIYDDLYERSCDFTPPEIQVEDDSLNLRISPDNPCIIQIRCGEDSWEDWYNPTDCIDEGAAGTARQPGPGGVVETGDCLSWDLVIQANQQLLLPVPVQGGMTLTFTNADGGWNDGGIPWYCPDGSGYALGTCNPYCGHEVGDPSATACHMALVLQVGATYHPADSGTVTIPGGVLPTDAFLQANDGSLSDNSGSISVHVEICQVDAPSYCFEWDLSIGAYDYAVQGCYNHGVYTAATGFQDTNFNPSANAMAFEKTLAAPVTVTRLEYDFNVSAFAGTHIGFYPSNAQCVGAVAAEQDLISTGDHTLVYEFPTGYTFSGGWFGLYGASDNTASHWTVKKMRAYGPGANPFGADNC